MIENLNTSETLKKKLNLNLTQENSTKWKNTQIYQLKFINHIKLSK